MFMRPTFPGSQRSMQTPQADCALEPLERMHFTAPLAGITCHRSGCSAAMIVEVRACCVKVDEECVCVLFCGGFEPYFRASLLLNRTGKSIIGRQRAGPTFAQTAIPKLRPKFVNTPPTRCCYGLHLSLLSTSSICVCRSQL